MVRDQQHPTRLWRGARRSWAPAMVLALACVRPATVEPTPLPSTPQPVTTGDAGAHKPPPSLDGSQAPEGAARRGLRLVEPTLAPSLAGRPVVPRLLVVDKAPKARVVGPPTAAKVALRRAAPLSEAGLRAAAAQVIRAWDSQKPDRAWFVADTRLCSRECAPGAPCPQNLLGVLRSTCYSERTRLSMDVSDREYLHAHLGALGGRMMHIPAEIIQASYDYPVVDDFKRALDRHGFRYLEFESTSVPNAPAGFWRILILIEHEGFDQWLQIAEYDGPPRTLARNVDLLVIQRQHDDGTVLEQPRFWFSGISRMETGRPRWEHEGVGSEMPLNRCVMCHPGGLRGIEPRAGSVADAERPMLRYVQQTLAAAPLPSYGGYYDVTRKGPVMGAVDAPGRSQHVAQCASELDAAAQRRVVEAMECARCHDGQERGVLNAITERQTLVHRIVNAPAAALMPPGPPLADAERQAVARCLTDEYREALRAWLLTVEGP